MTVYRTPATVPTYEEDDYLINPDEARIRAEIMAKPERTLRHTAERWGLLYARTRPFQEVVSFHVEVALEEYQRKMARSDRALAARTSLLARIWGWLRAVYRSLT